MESCLFKIREQVVIVNSLQYFANSWQFVSEKELVHFPSNCFSVKIINHIKCGHPFPTCTRFSNFFEAHINGQDSSNWRNSDTWSERINCNHCAAKSNSTVIKKIPDSSEIDTAAQRTEVLGFFPRCFLYKLTMSFFSWTVITLPQQCLQTGDGPTEDASTLKLVGVPVTEHDNSTLSEEVIVQITLHELE